MHHSYQAVEWALATMEDKSIPLAEMCSLECSLADVDLAIRGTGGELDRPVIHAAVLPGLDVDGGRSADGSAGA